MRYTVSLKKNRDFRRLYSSGKSSANHLLAMYYRRNKLGENRLGITVGTKVGGAVKRNRVRRLIREAYRLGEEGVRCGFDIIVVARSAAADAGYHEIDRALKSLFTKLGLAKT